MQMCVVQSILLRSLSAVTGDSYCTPFICIFFCNLVWTNDLPYNCIIFNSETVFQSFRSKEVILSRPALCIKECDLDKNACCAQVNDCSLKVWSRHSSPKTTELGIAPKSMARCITKHWWPYKIIKVGCKVAIFAGNILKVFPIMIDKKIVKKKIVIQRQ